MNIRQAILAAADAFDRGTRTFNFNAILTPYNSNSSACYVGEIAFQLGMEGGNLCGSLNCSAYSVPIIGVGFGEFTDRMYRLSLELGNVVWNERGPHNGALLRAYADKYHPATVAYPDWTAIASRQTVPADVELGAHQVAL